MIQEREPDLPITPTNEGRDPNLENFGYKVKFTDLWPLLIGLCGSGVMGIAFFMVGARPFHWSVCVVLTLLPLAAAHFYIKKFLENALPHQQGDTFAGWLSLFPEWGKPSRRVGLWPAWKRRLAMVVVPPWQSSTTHPMLRLRKEFERKKKEGEKHA